jgi:hypothetical protein
MDEDKISIGNTHDQYKKKKVELLQLNATVVWNPCNQ